MVIACIVIAVMQLLKYEISHKNMHVITLVLCDFLNIGPQRLGS